MKELTGRIVDWNEDSGCGLICGDDDKSYPFTSREWKDPDSDPQVDGNVLVICANGRDASRVEYLLIEHLGVLTASVQDSDGRQTIFSRSRMTGGPWRMYSDALAWMEAARGLHNAVSSEDICDIADLLRAEHLPISFRGSVIKYCYGFAVEIYLKWILSEAGLQYQTNHDLPKLVNRLKKIPVLAALMARYADYMERTNLSLLMRQAHVHGIDDLSLDWSTFENFVRNIHDMKFIVGRYGTIDQYSIFKTASQRRSHEMNAYMDSQDFFTLGLHMLTYKPNPLDLVSPSDAHQ